MPTSAANASVRAPRLRISHSVVLRFSSAIINLLRAHLRVCLHFLDGATVRRIQRRVNDTGCSWLVDL